MLNIVLAVFFSALFILAYSYKKISLSKNQVRSASIKFLNENTNYIIAWISYSILVSSLLGLGRISYESHNISEMLIVLAFAGILSISQGYFLSPYGLRRLK